MPKKSKRYEWSFLEGGMPGLHLTINPQPAVAPETMIYRNFLEHGVPLSSTELQALLSGREQGRDAVSRVLGTVAPGLGPDTRLHLSSEITDALMNYSLRGQLSWEAPTALERLDQQDERLRSILEPRRDEGMVDSLMRKVPVGVSLTIHFDFPGPK